MPSRSSRTTVLARSLLACGLAAGSLAATAVVAAPANAGTSATQTYVVLYSPGATSAAAAVKKARGTVVADYSAIGVVVARSSDSAFAATVRAAAGVQGASSTAGFGVKVADDTTDAGPLPGDAPATDGDTLSGLQWDMVQIKAPEAHAISGGSPSVLVGDIDTGLDFTHPDLAPNYDAANSTDCTSGVPAPLLPGNDVNGHGTHTAGTIAAAANGTGIVGVAPNVRIAGIKSGNDAGYFFPEAVICGYMWAATHGIDVTNNSYYADPWLFNCVNDPGQRAIWIAERRAIAYAQRRGTVVVASEGNESTDLSHPTFDGSSPDDSIPYDRTITNACSVIPVEVPGVVGVTATGNKRFKSYYSSYGSSTADVAAPGGDARLQLTAAAPNGRVLSTWPAADPCARKVVDPGTGAAYCYLQGTSMAGPHVAGIAALVMSRTGLRGGAAAAAVQQATDPLPCPADMSVYAPYPQLDGTPQQCTGGPAQNSFYGSGEVNALKAVS